MARRNESTLASTALVLLLGLTLLHGCRAFDPDPVIVNQAPETWIIGAPAETTGGRFERHLYWFGADEDGEVVQYIYAVTDSTVQDYNDGDGVDEEDDRFNPALDITTVTEPEGIVGWTTKTDSIFTFVVDRGPTTAKDITFHVVAVDDRGAIDPSPARLHFFDNSLGNPEIRFNLYIDEGPGGTSPPDWNLRWVGSPLPVGVDASVSPEGSDQPFVGFSRRFRITWEASSPNGEIIGYRFKPEQGPGAFTPPLDEGEKRWDDQLTEFIYDNDVPPTEFGAVCDTFTGAGCPPESVRFPSGNYNLTVEALDDALVESAPGGGELTFQVNYPPETSLVRGTDDQGEEWPRYELRDMDWNLVEERAFSSGDTIPANAYVKFRSTGFDRLPSFAGAEFDSFCCDTVLDEDAFEVRYQARLEFRGSDGARVLRFNNQFSTPAPVDTLGFITGPFNYEFISRTVDEHRRPDPAPAILDFVSGFPPKVVSVDPAPGDTIIFRAPTATEPWPENDYPYTISDAVNLFWDGRQYLEDDPGCGIQCQVTGNFYIFRPQFVGKADDREARSAVRAWTYSMKSEFDAENIKANGPNESPDLSFFTASPQADVWEFSEEEGVAIFVPSLLWLRPELYEPASQQPSFQQQGDELKGFLGAMTFRVRGRTTSRSDEYTLYQNTRPGPDEPVQNIIDVGPLGRRTEVSEHVFHVYLGIDKEGTGQIQRLWPDF